MARCYCLRASSRLGFHSQLSLPGQLRTAACSLILVAWFVTTIGCGSTNRFPVSGTITLDGQPLATGQVNFVPLSGTSGPTAGSRIVDGQYSISSDKGPMIGKFRVEISAIRETTEKNRTLNTLTGEMETVAKWESIVPARYNRDSELTAEVTLERPNQFDFALKSK